MERVITENLHTVGTAMQPSLTAQICAISNRYEGRGLAKAVAISAREQVEAENETRALARDAYRLSALSDATVRGLYRRGKDVMSTGDLIRYFGETRERRIQHCDFADAVGVYENADPLFVGSEQAETAIVAAVPAKQEMSVAALRGMVKKKWKVVTADWFCTAKAEPKSEKQKKKFPLSAVAAMIAVAVSLMLIVASSVLLTRTESRISALTVEANALNGEVAELRSDTEVAVNLLQLRQVATEEFGMVDEEYLKTHYLNTQDEETVTAYEQERGEGVGLSALLSAMGIKK